MSVKDFIVIILSYFGLRFVDKFIEDNLPNLHYKNIINGFFDYVVPFILMGYIGFLYLQLKISSNKEVQKSLQNAIILITATIILQQVLKKTDHKVKNNISANAQS